MLAGRYTEAGWFACQDLVEELAAPQWWVDRKGEVPKGKLDYYQMRIFQYYKGYLSSPYTATYYELAQRHPQVGQQFSPGLEVECVS